MSVDFNDNNMGLRCLCIRYLSITFSVKAGIVVNMEKAMIRVENE